MGHIQPRELDPEIELEDRIVMETRGKWLAWFQFLGSFSSTILVWWELSHGSECSK